MGDWQFILSALVMYVLYGALGVALTFHRILAHGAFKLNPFMRKVLITIGSFANVGSAITWVAVHRAHHRFTDTVNDPHSPHHKSFWYMLFGTMYSKVHPKYSINLMRDGYCRFLHNWYFAVQLPYVIALFMLGGWQAALAFHFVPGGLTWLGGSLVNYVNHLHGYKTSTTLKGTSTNNLFTGFLVFGEGWHSEHHATPTKPTTKVNWWEFDLVFHLGKLVGKVR